MRMDAAELSAKPIEELEVSSPVQNSSRVEGSASAEVKVDTAPKASTKSTDRRKQQQGNKHPRLSRKMKKPGKRSKVKEPVSSSDESSDSSQDTELSSSSSSSDSDTTDSSSAKRKLRRRRHSQKKSPSKTKKSKRNASNSSSSDEESGSGDDTDSGTTGLRRRSSKKKARRSSHRNENDEEERDHDEDNEHVDDSDDEIAQLKQQIARLETRRRTAKRTAARASKRSSHDGHGDSKSKKGKGKKTKKAAKKASTLEFKRVDQLWDNSIHDYKLTESAEAPADEFGEYIFTVRRKFDWEGKYKCTVVDVKSKCLREALQEVMKDVRGISLVEESPSIDPNMLFLYLEELRVFAKKTLKTREHKAKKRKSRRSAKNMRSQLKVLINYLDEDYEETKKTLYPMLESGNITFDLLWALFKPNTIAFTTTYGSAEHPRAFKVDYANRESSFMRGEWYCIEGRYLEYDGKSYGLGDFEVDIDQFKGVRKVTSLSTYPLQYHKDPESIKSQLIERGKKFVSLEGMNYRFHNGLAFLKKKRTVAKVNINGRIMIDPAIFRRINPNYPISLIKPKDQENMLGDGSDNEEDCSCAGDEDSEQGDVPGAEGPATLEEAERTGYKIVMDKDDKPHLVEVSVDADGNEIPKENMETLAEGVESKREFTEEELLIASPVVFGFAFSEKLWLEFTLSGVREIDWNEGAFESLVLPPNQKSIVRALVESHKFDAAKTIDDVVQGKGRGLVAVLHGPPGTGKTLTAEGIAELLKCPLYMVSAGELGTDPRVLEHELQKILDIAHSWGAVLLLDEADVFLEKREVHDIHRNALVSIFLRLLEYFQGILFLTTNRVETFDDAFQSRIHVALRYGDLTTKAKRTIWKMFIEKVQTMEASAVSNNDGSPDQSQAQTPTSSVDGSSKKAEHLSFRESDFDDLARRILNGRQIKNAVRTAQALAVNERLPMNMEHIKRVLDVAESFDRDLKGGTGYADAMRSYT